MYFSSPTSSCSLQGLANQRVEKAEILEHTVTFLNGHDRKQERHNEQHFQDGYTACLQMAGDFLRNVGLNGGQMDSEVQMRAFAVQLAHLDRCIGTPVPILHSTCGAPPELCPTQYQWPRLLAHQGHRHSSIPKGSPKTHSAKTLSPLLINSQTIWRPWS